MCKQGQVVWNSHTHKYTEPMTLINQVDHRNGNAGSELSVITGWAAMDVGRLGLR